MSGEAGHLRERRVWPALPALAPGPSFLFLSGLAAPPGAADVAGMRRDALVAGHADMTAPVGRRGVARAWLKPAGVGPAAPVAGNRTPEGHARNRRVGLVERP